MKTVRSCKEKSVPIYSITDWRKGLCLLEVKYHTNCYKKIYQMCDKHWKKQEQQTKMTKIIKDQETYDMMRAKDEFDITVACTLRI